MEFLKAPKVPECCDCCRVDMGLRARVLNSTCPRSISNSATPGVVTMAVKRTDEKEFDRINTVWRLLESVAPRIAGEGTYVCIRCHS